MPVIGGVKMACEPCIRGHRSTKCNHANERVMIAVRKPGRPLSVCPHPTSNSCTCSSVSVALPRVKKCACGNKHRRSVLSTPSTPISAVPPPATPVQSADASGQLYTLTDSPNYNVQNTAYSKQGPTQPYGYATEGPPNNTNLYSAANTSTAGPYYGQGADMVPSLSQKSDFESNPFGLGAVDLSGVDTAATQFNNLQMLGMPAASAMGVPQTMHTAVPAPLPNSTSVAMTPQMTMASHAAGTGGSGCCGRRPQPTADLSPRHTPTSSTNSLVSTDGMSLISSTASPASSLGGPTLFPSLFRAQQQANDTQSWANYSPPTFSPNFAPVTAPLQQQLHQQLQQPFQSQMPLQQWQMTSASAPNMLPTMPPLFPASIPPMPSSLPPSMLQASKPMNEAFSLKQESLDAAYDTQQLEGYAHQPMHCTCGPGCECVGCIDHPHNQATLNEVRSAVLSMMDRPYTTMGMAGAAADLGAGSAAPATDGYHSMMNGPNGANGANATNGNGADLVKTPSDDSVASDEQTVLPQDGFLLVQYPMCEGESYSCPCGDGCKCFGCNQHHNLPQ